MLVNALKQTALGDVCATQHNRDAFFSVCVSYNRRIGWTAMSCLACFHWCLPACSYKLSSLPGGSHDTLASPPNDILKSFTLCLHLTGLRTWFNPKNGEKSEWSASLVQTIADLWEEQRKENGRTSAIESLWESRWTNLWPQLANNDEGKYTQSNNKNILPSQSSIGM